jgi:hypothetical protein
MHTHQDAQSPRWPDTFLPISGIVYVATGIRFVKEAAAAAAQIRKTNPGLPICLITDSPEFSPAFWDHLIIVINPHLGFRDKILMGLCPYERFLYLDTDTHVVADISEMLSMLNRFDFIGHQLFEGHDCPLPGIPDAFPEFQGGVVGIRRSPLTANFFSTWLSNYNSFYSQNNTESYHYSNASDQKSLRLTVWNSGISVGVLGPEYDFTPHHLDFACADVKIFHGRGMNNLLKLEQRLNANLGNRVYVPRFDTIVSNDMPVSELRQLWAMVTLQLVAKTGILLTPRALRNKLRKMRLFQRLFLRNNFSENNPANDPKWKQTN